jgi:hypothetical protein
LLYQEKIASPNRQDLKAREVDVDVDALPLKSLPFVQDLKWIRKRRV